MLSSTTTVSVPISSSIANSDKAIVRAFLNGFTPNAGTQGLQIQVEAKSVQPNAITVAVATGPATSLRSVQFSYLIFSPTQVPFSSYGGFVSRTGFSGAGFQSIAGELQSANLVLTGVVRLSTFSPITFSTTLDDDFVLGYKQEGAALDFVLSYVAVGVNSNSVCAACETEKLGYGRECVSTCPAGSYTFNHKDGSQSCRRCSAKLNLALNLLRNGCECAAGFEMQNGGCVLSAPAKPTNSFGNSDDLTLIGVNQKQTNGVSSISQIASNVISINNENTKTNNTNTNVNIPGAIISISSNNNNPSSFNPIIAPTIIAVPDKKPVVSPPSITGGGAILIPVSPTPSDPSANSYVPTIPSSPSQPPSSVTPPPTIIVPPLPPSNGNGAESADSAQSCSIFANTYWSGYRCACRVGYKVDPSNGQCVRISFLQPVTPPYVPPIQPPYNDCRENEVLVYNQCVCATGYTKDPAGRCILNIVCPENSFLQAGICVCTSGYIKVNERCIPSNNGNCPANSYFNGVTCLCNAGFVMAPNSNVCVLSNNCPPFSQLVGSTCQCIAGYR